MKTLNNISKLALATLLAFAAMTGCRESADLTGDPTPVVVPYTFTPSHGYPGTEVLIAGANFSNVTSVSFGVKQAEIIQKSDSQISVYVPVGALSGEIKIVSKGIVIASATDFVVDNSPIPTIISFSPAIVGSNETVTIAGSLLNIVDSVYVGELKAVLDEATQTASELSFVTPVGLQSGKIRLFYDYKTDYGMTKPAETKSETDLSLKLPTIESISPDIATLNVGDELTIVGTMLDKVTSVKFGTIEADLATATVTATEMKLKVPVGATTGKMTFAVTDGTIEHTSDFTVNLPAIASFFPFKGAEITGGVRDITLSGTKMDLVTSAIVGTTSASIMSQNETNITLRIPGTTTGVIKLNTTNGVVASAAPFVITGEFWINDYDNAFTPARFTHHAWDGVNNAAFSTVASGESRGNYVRASGNIKNETTGARFYFRGDGGTGNPAPDRFLLYTSTSKDVDFKFDMSFNALPASMIDADGNVTLKVFFFAADQARGYGYSTLVKVKHTGLDNWQTVIVDTYKMCKETSSGGLNTITVPAMTNHFEPNNCRILGVVFVSALGKTDANDGLIDVNFDNMKFVIK